MKHRFLTTLSLLAIAISQVSWADTPMTKWGTPSLQGTWDFRSITPFQRPEAFKDKEFLTLDEVADFEETVNSGRAARAAAEYGGPGGQSDVDVGYNTFYLDLGTQMTGTMRTSLVVDPPNGRLPAMTTAARERGAAFRALWSRPPEGPEDRNNFDRCILGFNAGPPMTPGAYNNIMQIVQTEDYIVIQTEMVNDHRIIPTNGGEALPDHMRLWKGDSRGVWDGNTFVVTTTNFTHLSAFRGTGMSMTLTERFTRQDEEVLLYEYTIDDPESYEATWSTALEMKRTDALLFEYACHEGNYAMPLMLNGARKQERENNVDDTWLPSWSRPRQ